MKMNGSFLVKTPLFKTYIYLNLKNQLIPVRTFLTAHEVNRPIPKTISKFSEKTKMNLSYMIFMHVYKIF